MAAGRREEMRMHAISQAAVFFGGVDVERFIHRGDLSQLKDRPLDPELQANVDREIARIMANGRKLIVEG
jgi:hypothetical protein